MSDVPPLRPARIAIVGRPNVGKSTIFNRLIKRRKAIESEVPGTTRDRVVERRRMDGLTVELIDTAGLFFQGELEDDVRKQAQIAITEADVVLFIVSATEEMTVSDFSVAKILREAKKSTILVANKCDNELIEHASFNLYELGFGQPVQVSGVHNRGFDALTGSIVKLLRGQGFSDENSHEAINKDELRLCLIGRPNVGKSSFFNALIGEKRAIVSEIPGTTRDEIDTLVVRNGIKYRLVDTAGIRRRGKVRSGIEGLSVLRSISAIDRSDVVFLLIDYKEGVTNQDMHVVEEAIAAGKGIVLVVNKSDLMPKGEEAKESFINYLQKKCAFLSFVPVLFTSALTGKNVDNIYALADEIAAARRGRIPTAELNEFFKKIMAKRAPHGTKQVKPKLLYVTQVDINPPHFILFVNDPDAFHFSYKRYMQNQLRERYGFTGTVIKMDFRGREKIPWA